MRFLSSLAQHPDIRRKRFPAHLWPPEDVDDQTKDEWWIFLEFIEAARLSIEGAPTKGVPDFECTIGRERRLFELGEILDSDLASGLAYSGKQSQLKSNTILSGDLAGAGSINTFGRRKISANGALVRMLERKLTAKYVCNDIRCDLLLFYDRQLPYGPFECMLEIETLLLPLLEKSSFEVIWFFNLPSAQVMGRVKTASSRQLSVVFDHEFHFNKSAPFDAVVVGADDDPGRIQRFEPVLAPLKEPKK
jgi:hypothetical protein